MNTRLYHCTKAENLKNILKTGAFYPSFCLEESNFMRINIPFAFAMVSFADLMDVEKEDHMKTFKSNSYIVMKKNWAINNAVISNFAPPNFRKVNPPKNGKVKPPIWCNVKFDLL